MKQLVLGREGELPTLRGDVSVDDAGAGDLHVDEVGVNVVPGLG